MVGRVVRRPGKLGWCTVVVKVVWIPGELGFIGYCSLIINDVSYVKTMSVSHIWCFHCVCDTHIMVSQYVYDIYSSLTVCVYDTCIVVSQCVCHTHIVVPQWVCMTHV